MKTLLLLFAAIFVNAYVHAQDNQMNMQYDFKSIASYNSHQQSGYEVFQTYKSSAVNGSQFFGDNWFNGNVITTSDHEINKNYLFIYDKLHQQLFIKSKDSNNIILADKSKIKSFNIISDRPHIFVPASKYDTTNKNYFEVLSENQAYILFKETTTTFERANNGNLSNVMMGHNQDTYTDHFSYYIYHNSKLERIKLNEGSMRKILKDDKAKADKYINEHTDESINEKYLVNLVEAISE